MRARWTRGRALAIGFGGIVGATARFAVIESSTSPGFPWPVLLVNAVGSFVLGFVMAEEWTHHKARLLLHDGVGIGFCGGLTTFSTLALEAAQYLNDDRVAVALGYVAISVSASIALAALGALTLRLLVALTQPLEEQL